MGRPGSRWPAVALGAAVVGALLAAAPNPAGPHSGATPLPSLPRLGPVRMVDATDVGDPAVATVPGRGGRPATYVRVGTTDWRSNVPTSVSTDLIAWRRVPDALPVLPVWAQPTISMTWAPALLHRRHDWVMYYSTQEARSGLECIGAAVSRDAAGPYTDSSAAPLVCQRNQGGSIDPSVVRVGDHVDLIWKNDGNAAASPDWLWVQPLARNDLGLAGRPTAVLTTDRPWERGVVEGPAMVAASHGGYWLFYAGGSWSSDSYGTGLAYCRTVLGPCAKTSVGPYLASSGQLISPGGLELFTAADGKLWAAFTSSALVASRWHKHQHYDRVFDVAPVLSH